MIGLFVLRFLKLNYFMGAALSLLDDYPAHVCSLYLLLLSSSRLAYLPCGFPPGALYGVPSCTCYCIGLFKPSDYALPFLHDDPVHVLVH
jgi:hypothetical protein